jgi:hypothetical protein
MEGSPGIKVAVNSDEKRIIPKPGEGQENPPKNHDKQILPGV